MKGKELFRTHHTLQSLRYKLVGGDNIIRAKIGVPAFIKVKTSNKGMILNCKEKGRGGANEDWMRHSLTIRPLYSPVYAGSGLKGTKVREITVDGLLCFVFQFGQGQPLTALLCNCW